MSRPRALLGIVALGLYRSWRRIGSLGFTIFARGAFASCGKRTVIELPVQIRGERRIAIGHRVFIGAGSWIQTVGEGGIALEIGDGTKIAGRCVISAAELVRIGRDVLFASNVYVSDHNHAHEDPSRPVVEQGISSPRPVEIGDGAWLGENVVICPGVRIGERAVIGANSVVLDDIPARGVAVGAPARVIRVKDSVETAAGSAGQSRTVPSSRVHRRG